MDGITFKTVSTPADFALFTWTPGAWESAFYTDGALSPGDAAFFPEIFLEIEVDQNLQQGLPDQEISLVCCEGEPEGWELVIDRYGFLEFRALAPGTVTFRSGTPLTTFVGRPFRVGLTLANVCHPWRENRWWREALTYSRVTLLGAKGRDGRLCTLGEWGLEAPDLQPVPSRVTIPDDGPVRQVRAFNTVRHELFERTSCPDGPCLDGEFPDSSRAFAFCDSGGVCVDLFTGPEFFRSDSYWLFTRVLGAIPGDTRLRIHAASGYARRYPGMSPRFFWSPDRVVWDEVVQLEPSNKTGRFYSLLEAPAESFYLSTSIPFMQQELSQLLEWVEDIPFVSTQTLGYSVAGRPIPLLTLSDEAVPNDRKAHVVLTVGQHSPMEIVGAHVIAPIVRYIEAHPDVLQTLALHCVPVVNVDCAADGSDGMNMNLRNTNRCWFDDIQPETRCIMTYFDEQNWEPDFFLDLHSGG